MIRVLLFGAERAHDLGVCNFFPEIHEDVEIVGDVEGVSYFDVLGGFVGAGSDALSETYEFIFIGCVPCCS